MKAARVLGLLLAVVIVAAAFAEGGELPGTMTRELKPGASVRILRPGTRYPTPMKLAFEARSISFRFNSDGLLAVTDVAGPVDVEIRAGTRKLRMKLTKGQLISAWVVKEMIASAKEGLSLEVHMSSWSFALRADRAGPAGLVLMTETGVGTLRDGQRVDSVKSPTGEVKLARSGVSIPELTRREPRRSVEAAEGGAPVEGEPRRPGPPAYPPGRLSLRDTAWLDGATILLPQPLVEVMRPDAVSR